MQVGDQQPAFFLQNQCADADDGFGLRRDAKDRILGHGGCRLPIAQAECLHISHLAAPSDQGHATGRAYFTVLTRVGLDHWGRYLDDYRVVDGAWRFARRRVLTDDFSTDSLFRPPSGG